MTLLAKDVKAKLPTGDLSIEDSPSPPKLLHEHSKTVITLATTFFGLTAAFPERILGPDPETWQIVVLGLVWLFLMISIVSAIVIVVNLNAYLSGKEVGRPASLDNAWKGAASASTTSYIILVLAGLGVGALSIAQVTNSGRFSANESVSRALQFASSEDVGRGIQWKFNQLTWKDSGRLYDVVLLDESSGKRVCITIDGKTGYLLSCKPCI